MIPWSRFIETGAISDTLALLPIWDAFGSLLFDSIDATVLAGGDPGRGALPARSASLGARAARGLPALRRRRLAQRRFGEHGFRQASRERSSRESASATATGSTARCRTDASVAFIWKGVDRPLLRHENEFFNRSVGPIYFIGGPTPGGLSETEVAIDEPTGAIRTATGERVEARYVLAEDAVSPDGVVARSRSRHRPHALARRRPARATATRIEGRYPGDTWSGRTVT